MPRYYSHSERKRHKAKERNREIRNNPGYSSEEVAALKYVLGACTRCGSTEHLTKDHVKPIGRGGSNTLENLTILCSECNKKKGAKLHPNPTPSCLLPSQEQRLSELPASLRDRIRSVIVGRPSGCY